MEKGFIAYSTVWYSANDNIVVAAARIVDIYICQFHDDHNNLKFSQKWIWRILRKDLDATSLQSHTDSRVKAQWLQIASGICWLGSFKHLKDDWFRWKTILSDKTFFLKWFLLRNKTAAIGAQQRASASNHITKFHFVMWFTAWWHHGTLISTEMRREEP